MWSRKRARAQANSRSTKPAVMALWFILVNLMEGKVEGEFFGGLDPQLLYFCWPCQWEKFSKISPLTFKVSCIIAFTWFLPIHNRVHLVVKWSALNMNKFKFTDRRLKNWEFSLGNEVFFSARKPQRWVEGKWIFKMCTMCGSPSTNWIKSFMVGFSPRNYDVLCVINCSALIIWIDFKSTKAEWRKWRNERKFAPT